MNNNNKYRFRASFSVLKTWESGDYERAVKQYFKLESFTTPAMAQGKQFHEQWSNFIKKNNALPEIFNSKKLINPQSEQKIVVNIHDWLDLVGVIDCFDKPTIYEFKSGKESSECYASSKQGGIYGVLATYAGMYADKIVIYHYDQYISKSDMSIVWLTDKLLDESLNYIETLSSEMHHYLSENNLYQQFTPKPENLFELEAAL